MQMFIDQFVDGPVADAKKQSQMAALSRERETLQNTIQAYKTMFQTQKSLVEELRSKQFCNLQLIQHR